MTDQQIANLVVGVFIGVVIVALFFVIWYTERRPRCTTRGNPLCAWCDVRGVAECPCPRESDGEGE